MSNQKLRSRSAAHCLGIDGASATRHTSLHQYITQPTPALLYLRNRFVLCFLSQQERSSPLDRASDLRRCNNWNLEDDADIRVLLDIERPSVANTRTAKSGGSGTNHNSRGSRCSVQTRPVSCGGHDRCLAAPTGAARGTSSSTSSKGYMPTPRTVARRSRSEAETSSTGKGLDRSDKGQQQQRHRGERLGRGGIVDGAEVQKLFEVTAMGRKVHPLGRAAAEKPEVRKKKR